MYSIPDTFILSHFHVDHYNRLLYASQHSSLRCFPIKEVYYPRIPEFKERGKFIVALFTMNLRIFGSETGVMEYDFLETIFKINGKMDFKYRPVSKGDIINIHGSISVSYTHLTLPTTERV